MRSTDMDAVLGRGKVADILLWKNKTLSGAINFIPYMASLGTCRVLFSYCLRSHSHAFDDLPLHMVQDCRTHQKTLAGLYLLSFIGSLLSTMTFAYLVFACCATIPAFYEQNKMQVDEVLGKSYREINNLLEEFRSKLVDKIPRGKDD